MIEPQHHPITPPRELVSQWRSEPEYGTPGRVTLHTISEQRLFQLLTRSAQWGADQELEACCEAIKDLEWFEDPRIRLAELRATRRPKPPSLKEQALNHFESFSATFETSGGDSDLIRRALKALPND